MFKFKKNISQIKIVTLVICSVIIFSTKANSTKQNFSNQPVTFTIKKSDKEIYNFTQSSTAYPKEITIITFWVSWCDICRKELSAFKSITEKDKNIEIIAINFDKKDDDEDIEKILNIIKPNYKIFKFSELKNSNLPYPEKLPTTFILDKNNIIKKEFLIEDVNNIESEIKSAISI